MWLRTDAHVLILAAEDHERKASELRERALAYQAKADEMMVRSDRNGTFIDEEATPRDV